MLVTKRLILNVSLLIMVLSISTSINAQKSDSPLKDKKVLFVYGGWNGHEPELTRDIFVPWMKSEGAQLHVSHKLDSYTDSTLLNSLDLRVQI